MDPGEAGPNAVSLNRQMCIPENRATHGKILRSGANRSADYGRTGLVNRSR